MEQAIEAVAENLRAAREERGLSFDQMAELTGVSKSMLRQIETGKSSPTISTIWKIANGLRVSFTSLLRKPVAQAEVKSFKDVRPLTGAGEKYRLYPLIAFNPHQSFETYYFEIDPGAVFTGEPHKGDIHEYLFVTGGTLRITIDDRIYTVRQNEFLQFKADRPHRYACDGDTMATVIMQLSYLS
jgi:transcriptional regulator with XRE-family HTH domain